MRQIPTKFYSLVFDYSILTMEKSGRHWAATAYKNKDYIFSYSAASIATILHHNPDIDYLIMTDDVELLKLKLSEYQIPPTSYFRIEDFKDTIDEWKSNKYCFWPLIKSMDLMVSTYSNAERRIVKLDNDLTCLKPLDFRFYSHEGSHVWKFERMCSAGREYWGERLSARKAFGTDEFKIYNTGIWSIHPDHSNLAKDIPEMCSVAAGVDISSVSYFPDRPGVKAATWNCADQTSNNYWLHKNKISVLETHEWFVHHCYVTNKEGVFKGAEYLKK